MHQCAAGQLLMLLTEQTPVAAGSEEPEEGSELDDAVAMQAYIEAEAFVDLEELAALEELIAIHGNDALKVPRYGCHHWRPFTVYCGLASSSFCALTAAV